MRLGGRTVLGLLLSVLVLGTTAAWSNGVYEEAVERLRAHDYEGAAAQFEILVMGSPQYVSGWSYLAFCRWKLGNLEGAERAASRALEIDPASFAAHHTLGLVLYDQHRYEDSVRELRLAWGGAETPGQRRIVSAELANALYRAGEYEEAKKILEDRLRNEPGNAADLYLLGLTCQRLKDYACALEQLRAAREANPQQAGITRSIAELTGYMAAQEGTGAHFAVWAKEEAERWVSEEPGNPDARVHFVELLIRQGLYSDAIDESRSAFSQHPGQCKLLRQATKAALRLERFDTAREMAGLAVTCDPDSAEARNDLARAQLGEIRAVMSGGEVLAKSEWVEQRLAEAEAALDRSEKLDPDGEAVALRSESAGLAKAYREQHKIEMDDRAIVNERRCEELKVQLYQIRTAESTGVAVERLSAEEREFLKRTCGVDPR